MMARIEHLLTLDAASRITGYALFRVDCNAPGFDVVGGGLVDAGLLVQKGKDLIGRLDGMCKDVMGLLAEVVGRVTVVIEMPDRLTGRSGQHRGAAMAIYGCACGALWGYLTAQRESEVDVVAKLTSSWRIGKTDRATAVAECWPKYSVERDRGLDVSDALYMGIEWFEQKGVWLCR